jgi:hypothetical protein
MGTHMCTRHVGLLVTDPFHHDGHGHGGMYVWGCMCAQVMWVFL